MKYQVQIKYTNPAHEHVSLRRRVDTVTRLVEANSEQEAINRAANQQRSLGFMVREANVLKEEVEQMSEANRKTHLATFVPKEGSTLKDHISIPVNPDHGSEAHKNELAKIFGKDIAKNYELQNVSPKTMNKKSDTVEQIDEAIDPEVAKELKKWKRVVQKRHGTGVKFNTEKHFDGRTFHTYAYNKEGKLVGRYRYMAEEVEQIDSVAEAYIYGARSTEFQDLMRQVRPKGKGITKTEFQNFIRRKGKKEWHCPECATYDDNVHGKFCSKYKPKQQGVSEQVEQIDEMDKSQPSSSRGAEGLALGKKANPVKPAKVRSNALKILQKQYKKAKEEVEQIDEVKGDHRPGWMLRADPNLANKVKATRNRGKKITGLMNKFGGLTGDQIRAGVTNLNRTVKEDKDKRGSEEVEQIDEKSELLPKQKRVQQSLVSSELAKNRETNSTKYGRGVAAAVRAARRKVNTQPITDTGKGQDA